MKWRAISDPAYNVRSWGDEFVVYNTLSGDTHMLGFAAAQILFHLCQTPATTAALAVSLAAELEVDMNDDLTNQIDTILADLNSLALIEAA